MTDDVAPGAADPRASSVTRGATDTAWIWLVVFLPLAGVALLFTLDVTGTIVATDPNTGMASAPMATGVFALGKIAVAAGGVILAAFGIFCAYRDWVHLRRMTLDRPFGWAWQFAALVGAPVYAIGRAVVVRRRTGRGVAVLVVAIVVSVVAVVLATAWAFLAALTLSSEVLFLFTGL